MRALRHVALGLLVLGVIIHDGAKSDARRQIRFFFAGTVFAILYGAFTMLGRRDTLQVAPGAPA